MDFVKLLRSFEEFLYEAMTWVIFYPRTLLAVARHPIQALRYSQTELTDTLDEQYIDSVSPPLFLMLTLLIVHGLELASNVGLPVSDSSLMYRIFRSEQNLLIVRSLIFAVFPLVFAFEHLKLSGQAPNRQTLRAPFFGQCYPASLFALLAGTATILVRDKHVAVQLGGLALFLLALVWYVTVEVIWFRTSLPDRRWAGLGAAIAFLKAFLVVATTAFALSQIGG